MGYSNITSRTTHQLRMFFEPALGFDEAQEKVFEEYAQRSIRTLPYVPEINSLYPYQCTIGGEGTGMPETQIFLLFKPRGFRKTEKKILWYVVVVEEAKFQSMLQLPAEQRDFFVTDLVPFTDEEAGLWVAKFGDDAAH